MKTIFLFFLMMWFVPVVWGQKVEYVYDAAGNRTQRKVITLQKTSKEDDEATSTATVPHYLSDAIATAPEGFDDMLGERKIVIYPNPTQGLLRIECSGGGELKDARLLLYDMQGRLLRQIKMFESSQILDLSQYPEGVYILQIIEGVAKSEWKIVKE